MNFRKLLLNRCQKEFERDQDDDKIFEKKQKELDASEDVSIVFHFACANYGLYAQNFFIPLSCVHVSTPRKMSVRG